MRSQPRVDQTLTDESRVMLERYVAKLLDSWGVDDAIQAIIRMRTWRRPRAVTAARDRLITVLRDTVWQWGRKGKKGANEVIIATSDEDVPYGLRSQGFKWRPITTTNIGALLHLTHGAVCHALERERKRLTSQREDG